MMRLMRMALETEEVSAERELDEAEQLVDEANTSVENFSKAVECAELIVGNKVVPSSQRMPVLATENQVVLIGVLAAVFVAASITLGRVVAWFINRFAGGGSSGRGGSSGGGGGSNYYTFRAGTGGVYREKAKAFKEELDKSNKELGKMNFLLRLQNDIMEKSKDFVDSLTERERLLLVFASGETKFPHQMIDDLAREKIIDFINECARVSEELTVELLQINNKNSTSEEKAEEMERKFASLIGKIDPEQTAKIMGTFDEINKVIEEAKKDSTSVDVRFFVNPNGVLNKLDDATDVIMSQIFFTVCDAYSRALPGIKTRIDDIEKKLKSNEEKELDPALVKYKTSIMASLRDMMGMVTKFAALFVVIDGQISAIISVTKKYLKLLKDTTSSPDFFNNTGLTEEEIADFKKTLDDRIKAVNKINVK